MARRWIVLLGLGGGFFAVAMLVLLSDMLREISQMDVRLGEVRSSLQDTNEGIGKISVGLGVHGDLYRGITGIGDKVGGLHGEIHSLGGRLDKTNGSLGTMQSTLGKMDSKLGS